MVTLRGQGGCRGGVRHAFQRLRDHDGISVDGAGPERPPGHFFLSGVLDGGRQLSYLALPRALHDERTRWVLRDASAERHDDQQAGESFHGAGRVACQNSMTSAGTNASSRRRGPSADTIGGITTFFTMAYIVVVNPGILSTPGTCLPFSGALTATVLVASTMTLAMGLYARLPFAVAPGMGLNAFFAFTIVLQSGVPWQTALGMVSWAGVLFLVVSATPLREHIALAIPPPLRAAAAAGIGLLLTFIGLRNAGLL